MPSFLILYICIIAFSLANDELNSGEFENFVPSGYNKLNNPPDDGSEKFRVKFVFNPFSITEVSIKTMDFTVNMLVFLSWKDMRLNNSAVTETKIKLPNLIKSKIWYPRIVLGSCKRCEGTLIDLEKCDIYYFSETKKLEVRKKIIVKFDCRFNMTSYPFDIQTCEVQFVCTSITSCQGFKTYFEIESNLDISRVNMPPEFQLQKIGHVTCDVSSFPTGTTCNGYFLKIKRVRIRPILIIFVPSVFLVVISWISFWLDVKATAPRVTLGLTVMLTLSTHFNAAQRDLPAVSTIMAVDIWMFCCIFIVFASLVEFAIVHFCDRSKSSSIATGPDKRIYKAHCFTNLCIGNPGKNSPIHISTGLKLDVLSRLLFPLTFFIFNVFFWLYYL